MITLKDKSFNGAWGKFCRKKQKSFAYVPGFNYNKAKDTLLQKGEKTWNLLKENGGYF